MAAASIIGPGTVVRGNVRGPGSIEIRGRVEGDVEVDGDVALGEGAAVNGNVTGAQVLIAGQVAGDLRGSEAVLLERGARVVGDLVAPRIGVAEGALVRGSVRTEGEPTAPRRAQVLPARRGGERSDFGASKLKAAPAAATRPAGHGSSPHAAPMPANPAPKPAAPPAQVDATASGPPAPVVPALGKGVKAKKKSKRP